LDHESAQFLLTERKPKFFKALQFEILDLDPEDARRAGKISAHLASAGTPIGPYDVLIAGQALARSLTLVTHNMREFQRASGLSVEDLEN